MKGRAINGWKWYETHPPAPPGLGLPERTAWIAVVPGIVYPDGSPVEIKAELPRDGDKWFITDNGGALRASPAPNGVIGTLMGRTEDFYTVYMLGDGPMCETVPHLPAQSRWRRIGQAAMRVATYSLFMAWAAKPAWWPPTFVITMTLEEALRHGVYDELARQKRSARKKRRAGSP